MSDTWQQGRVKQLSTLPEYTRFIKGAYACGFVCDDFSPSQSFNGLTYDQVLTRPHVLREGSLQLVRQVVHAVVRSERWNFQVVDEEVGVVWQALEKGLINEIANRLTAFVEMPHS